PARFDRSPCLDLPRSPDDWSGRPHRSLRSRPARAGRARAVPPRPPCPCSVPQQPPPARSPPAATFVLLSWGAISASRPPNSPSKPAVPLLEQTEYSTESGSARWLKRLSPP